jgi:hypothetical protein
MTSNYPALFDTSKSSAPEDALEEFEQSLHSENAVRAAAALPLDADESAQLPEAGGQRAFLNSLIDRLQRLGYLSRKQVRALKGRPRDILVTPEIRGSVRMFQREAGITEDEWLGPQTWTALQAMYCFEGARSELGRAVRFEGGLSLAERRAAMLRLDALGLVSEIAGRAPLTSLSGKRLNIRVKNSHRRRITVTPAAGSLEKVKVILTDLLVPPLQRFRLVLAGFGLDEATLEDTALIRFLLDHDGMVARLAASLPSDWQVNLGAQADQFSPAERRAAGFVGRILSIEMWLLDQDVPLIAETSCLEDAGSLAQLQATITSVLVELANTTDGASLPARVLGVEGQKLAPDELAARCLPLFPRILIAIEHVLENSGADDAMRERLVEESLTTAEAKGADAVEAALAKETSNRRSRLWDGIRRAIGWMKRFIGRIIKTVAELAKRIVRVVFAFSAEALNAARDAFLVVKTGLEFLSSHRFTGPFESLYVERGLGSDSLVFADISSPEKSRRDALFLRLSTEAAQRAAALIARLIAAVRKIIARLSAGWIVIGLALLKLSRQARHFARWLAEMRVLAAEIRDVSTMPQAGG